MATSRVSARQLEKLEPWLEGAVNDSGEVGVHCPFPGHGDGDQKRSGSLNVETGAYYCQGCGVGAGVADVVGFIEDNEMAPPEFTSGGGKRKSFSGSQTKAPISEGMVQGYVSALHDRPNRIEEFVDARGIGLSTVKEFEIGWDQQHDAYTIPVRDADGELLNIRFYTLRPADDRRKIWSLPGRGEPVLFPGHMLHHMGDSIIICEGELDALITMQHGFDVVTRTGAAKVWKSEWNNVFRDKVVYLAHDCDVTGQDGNRRVAAALEPVVAELYVIRLPYSIEKKHGKDLTDFWLDGHSRHDLFELMMDAEPWGALADAPAITVEDISVLGSFDSGNVGQKLRLNVTITGKRSPAYILPSLVEYECDQDAGVKCAACPMNANGYDGRTSGRVEMDDPMVLEMMNATNDKVYDLLRTQVTPVKCGKLRINHEETRAVEELYVRPSVDREQNDANIEAGDYMTRKVVSVGRHDSMPSNTVTMVGSIFPNPRTQHNELMVWDVQHLETSVDKFQMTPENLELLQAFQPYGTETPLQKVEDICTDLTHHVTKIYGRPHMHMLMDLVFHSLLAFPFEGEVERRGWLDALIIGDTRTGKSAAAQALRSWYGCGEFISCESASFAGIVGGLQQLNNKEWAVTWGAVPINDRRMVILDEVSGLTPDQIGQMSSIRSSGEAQLVKIQQERTYARTRLLWLGNPRDAQMSDFAYGVQALRPLIGANEDVARFDLAMSVAKGEVSSAEINRHHQAPDQAYSREACQAMIGWAWSRQPNHVKWEPGAEAEVYTQALEIGGRYSEDPPLIQAANVRVKIARVAAALAARTFSTDETNENIIIKKIHVQDAVVFMDGLYGADSFGYGSISSETMRRVESAEEGRDEAKDFLGMHPGLARFLRTHPKFNSNDIATVLGYSRDEAGQIVSRMWQGNMITKESVGNKFTMTKTLQELIKGMELV